MVRAFYKILFTLTAIMTTMAMASDVERLSADQAYERIQTAAKKLQRHHPGVFNQLKLHELLAIHTRNPAHAMSPPQQRLFVALAERVTALSEGWIITPHRAFAQCHPITRCDGPRLSCNAATSAAFKGSSYSATINKGMCLKATMIATFTSIAASTSLFLGCVGTHPCCQCEHALCFKTFRCCAADPTLSSKLGCASLKTGILGTALASCNYCCAHSFDATAEIATCRCKECTPSCRCLAFLSGQEVLNRLKEDPEAYFPMVDHIIRLVVYLESKRVILPTISNPYTEDMER